MLTSIPLWTLLSLFGCGLKEVLPGKPVLNNQQLSGFSNPTQSAAEYTDEPRVPFPVIPMTAFGLQYSADVVLVSQHPDWDMHEFARLDMPSGPIWIAKDSRHSGEQTIVADVPGLNTWMPEIPAPRIEAPIDIVDRSDGDHIDIEMNYVNPAGQATAVWAKGTLPAKPPAKRNGNTMGHSRDVVAAVLDIERFGSKIKAGITIDGQPQKLDRVLGIVPFKFLLRQTQAGVVVTNFRQSEAEHGFTLTRPSPSEPEWPTQSVEQWSTDGSNVSYDNGVAKFAYHFLGGGLSEISVKQHGLSEPTFQLQIQPALPDLRRTFEGEYTSRFVMHVNGQRAHGFGILTAQWRDDSSVAVRFTPKAPFWLADRPMETIIRFTEGAVDVRTTRIAE